MVTGFNSEHAAAIEAMQSDRGWIVNSYAQVEFNLADTVVRCREFAEYHDVTGTMPYKLEGRVRRFERIVELDGPLTEQRDDLRLVLANFRASSERRQFLVHGFATFHHTPHGDMAMRFDRFMPDDEDPFRRRSMWFRPITLAEIRTIVLEETAFAMDTFIRLHARLGWIE